VQQQKGTLGKLIYDSSFHDNALQLLANSNNLLGDVRAGRGTLGKLATDDSLFTSFRQIGTNLQTATAKLNDNNSTAGKFFSDPQFYDNLTGLMGDMRLLVGDFRTNPKKFLHVQVSLF
jgi:phospholipid/cholesterol/gamma-HCH transport system substrate-binding protein